MSDETFRNYFLRLSAPLRYLSLIYGLNWHSNGWNGSRCRSAIFLIWSISILSLNIIPNVYLCITKLDVHFKAFYVNKEMPMSSVMAIIDRLNKMIYCIVSHLLVLLSFDQTFEILFDKFEPISKALDKPNLLKIRIFSNCSLIWLLALVSNERILFMIHSLNN